MSEEATAEVEVEANPLKDLVDAALAKDYNKANEIFGQAITVKLDDVMDQERIRLSNSIYNASDEDEEDEVEDEDMEDSEDVSDDDVDVDVDVDADVDVGVDVDVEVDVHFPKEIKDTLWESFTASCTDQRKSFGNHSGHHPDPSLPEGNPTNPMEIIHAILHGPK